MPCLNAPIPSFSELEDRLHFEALWRLGIRGKGATVAVLDTGMQSPCDADSAVSAERDFTGEESPRGNGYEHGSAVAKGIHLIAPEASIANFRVVPERGPLARETVCQAVRFCIEQYPKYPILNLSLYFEPDACSEANPCALCSLVNEAARRGLVVVVAAGNEGPAPGTITCPGRAAEAITVVSTWTKREADWWDSLGRVKQWWLKDFTGQFGGAFGTSFSAAWVSGAVALLKSAFPECHPQEVKEAIYASAYALFKAPETAGLLQCKEALDLLLSPNRYESAKRALYINAGNRDAQRPDSYLAHEVGLALSFIQFKLMVEDRLTEAEEDLVALRKWLIPDAMPDQTSRLEHLLELCQTCPNHDS